jgi:hypothetical protein
MLHFVLVIFSRIDLYSNGCNVLKAVVEFLFLNDGYVPLPVVNAVHSMALLAAIRQSKLE